MQLIMNILSISFLLLSAYVLYRYWRWACSMDQLNKDHWEYLKTAPIEGIDYFDLRLPKYKNRDLGFIVAIESDRRQSKEVD